MAMPIGGDDQAPFDAAAQSVIARAQRMFADPTPRFPLTREERQDAKEAIDKGALCLFCAGIHVGASTPACPRLASGKLNGDGTVVEFTYWNSWDAARVVFPEDIEDDEESGDDQS